MNSKKTKNESYIHKLIQLIKKEGIYSLHWIKTDVFMISAKEFLTFAKEDISESTVKGRVNALCNAKRAIENRIDTLLYNYGLYYHTKNNRWNFPTKINNLSEMGIKIPNLLKNAITSKRNLLEHEYLLPKNQEEVEDIIEIAELFLKASETYMHMNGTLRMINEPPGIDQLHMEKSKTMIQGKVVAIPNRGMGIDVGKTGFSYVVFFDYKNNFILFYRSNWKKKLKINEINENDMIKLIKAVINSDPPIQDVYKEWKQESLIKLAEETFLKYTETNQRA